MSSFGWLCQKPSAGINERTERTREKNEEENINIRSKTNKIKIKAEKYENQLLNKTMDNTEEIISQLAGFTFSLVEKVLVGQKNQKKKKTEQCRPIESPNIDI